MKLSGRDKFLIGLNQVRENVIEVFGRELSEAEDNAVFINYLRQRLKLKPQYNMFRINKRKLSGYDKAEL